MGANRHVYVIWTSAPCDPRTDKNASLSRVQIQAPAPTYPHTHKITHLVGSNLDTRTSLPTHTHNYPSSCSCNVLCCMTNLFCNVLVKLGKGVVEAEQGAIHELARKKSHATQHCNAKPEILNEPDSIDLKLEDENDED